MILADALGRWNVAARGQSREFFNTIHPEQTPNRKGWYGKLRPLGVTRAGCRIRLLMHSDHPVRLVRVPLGSRDHLSRRSHRQPQACKVEFALL
jgi:hypothetical protein